MIDHIVYGVSDLADGIHDLEQRLGVEAAYGGSHRGRGSHNALLGLGAGSYLEIIAADPGQAGAEFPDELPFGVHDGSRPRLLGWAITTPDVDEVVERARAAGYDPGDAAPMQRETADGTLLEWRLTPDAFPLPFLIDWGVSSHPSTSAPAGITLNALRLSHPDPETVATPLRALGADGLVAVVPGPQIELTATVAGPRGTATL